MLTYSLPAAVADPRAERVARRLTYVGAGPAANFRDACRLMAAERRLPTTTHLVGHLMREVESALRDVAEPAAVGAGGPATGTTSPTPANVAPVGAPPLGRGAKCPTCGKKVQPESHPAEIRRVLAWLDLPEAEGAGAAWLELSDRENPNALHKRAHRDNLNAPRPVDADFESWWDRLLDALDAVLERLEDRYGDVYARIDRLVADGPGAARQVGLEVPTAAVTQGYLVSRLAQLGPEVAAAWLVPLRDAAFFGAPPRPVPTADGDAVTLPSWPQAELLTLVAAERPAEVREILAGVDTENVNVLRQLLRAATALPPGEAAHLAPTVRAWVAAFGRTRGAPDAAKFVAHVLGDQAAAAPATDALYATAGALLGIEDDPHTEPEGRAWQRRGRDVAGDIPVLVPALLAHDAPRTLALLAAALDAGVAADEEAKRVRYAGFLRATPETPPTPGLGSREDDRRKADLRERNPTEAPAVDGGPGSVPAPVPAVTPTGATATSVQTPPESDEPETHHGPRRTLRAPGGPPRTFGHQFVSFALPSVATAAGVNEHRHRAHDTWELLALGLRDAGVAAITSGACTAADALDAVLGVGTEAAPATGTPSMAAGRVALAVLARCPDADPGLVAAWLLDPTVCDQPSLRAEYDALLTAGYRVLEPVDRARLAARLADELLPTWYGDVEPEMATRIVATRRRDRLAPLRGQLPEPHGALLATLVAKHGEPERSDQSHVTIAESSGPRTPVSGQELAAMTPDELLRYVAGWAPDTSAQDGADRSPRAALRAPAYDGLARTLEHVIAAEPARYADFAPAFAGMRPGYARAALQAFRSALATDREFPWAGPLALCGASAGVAGHAGEPDGGRDRDTVVAGAAHERVGELAGEATGERARDEEWRTARRAAAELVAAGLALRPDARGALPASARAQLWPVLARLAQDADPGPGGDQDSLFPTTVRAVAVEAVVAYAVWVAEASVRLGDGALEDGAPAGSAGDATAGTVPLAGFAAAPEAAGVLEAHARWEHDPSLSVRAAFGRRLGQLAAFDPAWTAAHLDALLPAAAGHAVARGAVTSVYLAMTRAVPAALPALAPLYRHVIETAGADHAGVSALAPGMHGGVAENAAEGLGAHLAALYWWGAAPLDDPNGLLATFFATATPQARENVLATLGRWLHNEHEAGGRVPDDVRDRLVRLWEWRAQANEGAALAAAYDPAGVRAERRELSAFGWWFACSQLDVGWRLARLEQALRLVGYVEPDYAAAETLAACAATRPAEAVACLALLDLDREESAATFVWRDFAADICRAALASGDASASGRARAVVGRWAARGHAHLRALSAPAPGGPPTTAES